MHENLPEQPEAGPQMQVRTSSSFLRLYWPFQMARVGGRSQYEGIVPVVQGAVGPGDRPLWSDLDLPVDMLLTHCSAHLNCWDGSPQHPRRDHETGHFWRIERSHLGSGGLFDPRREWLARHGSGQRATSASFSVVDANLVVFRQHIGFIMLEIVGRTADPADWLFLANRLRNLGGDRRSSSSGATIEVPASIDLPFFTPDGEAGSGGERSFSGRLGEVFRWLAQESLPNCHLTEPWVRDSALPYFSLFVDAAGSATGGNDADAPAVADLGERVRRFFRADQAMQATGEELTQEIMLYAPDQYHTYSLDGGGFFAWDAPATQFFDATLPDHLRRYYSLNYLFALHQRLVLMQLSEAIADRWMDGPATLDRSVSESTESGSINEGLKAELEKLVGEFEEIRNELLEFSARGYFIQFMHSQNHHRDYRRWQETFEVAQFHREVQNQMHEINAALTLRFEEIASKRRQMSETLEHRRTAAQTNFAYILAIFGVVSLVLAFFGVPIKGETQNGISLWKLLSYGIVAALFGAAIAYVVHLDTRRRGRRE